VKKITYSEWCLAAENRVLRSHLFPPFASRCQCGVPSPYSSVGFDDAGERNGELRVSPEMLMGGVLLHAVIGAPSILAVPLIGFLRHGRCNVYTDFWRISKPRRLAGWVLGPAFRRAASSGRDHAARIPELLRTLAR
jgi:hypothetical protein